MMGNNQPTSLKTRKQVVWFNYNINSKDNQEFIQNSFKHMVVNTFRDTNTAINFIKNNSEPFIVITTGKNGEEFVKKINNCYNVLYIIVFCYNVSFHREWASNYQKIVIVTKSKEELLKKLEECCKTQYIECDTKVVKEFWSVIFKFLGDFFDSNINKDLILKELTLLNQKCSTTIKKLFAEREKNILNAILYLYTTDYIYKAFNETLALKLYKQLLNTLTSTTKEILTWEYPNHNKINQPNYLYRGIKGNNVEIMFNFQEYLTKKIKPIYFPAFTSASSDLEQAMKFSNGIIFEIILSKNDPHPHIILETAAEGPYKDLVWTEYKNEKETLLFSYFPFSVENIREEGKHSIITLVQEEDCKVFSNEYSMMKKFWNKEIINEVQDEKKIHFPENFDIVQSIKLMKKFYLKMKIKLLIMKFLMFWFLIL